MPGSDSASSTTRGGSATASAWRPYAARGVSPFACAVRTKSPASASATAVRA